MTRSRIAILLALVVAVPATAASSSFFTTPPQPCFMAGAAGYRLTGAAAANYIVRVGESAAKPDLRLQIVEDPARADFVLLDDGDSADTCRDAGEIRSIRVDDAAAKPDVTVALSSQPAADDYKIYVRSAHFTERDAAALFAVIWKNARGRETVARR